MTKRRAPDTSLFVVLCVYLAAYVGLALNGMYLFVYKTALVPAFAIYGLLTGDIRTFARDWLPTLGAVVLFDACRGAVNALVQAGLRPVFVDYPIAVDRWLTGLGSSTAVLQQSLRSPGLDKSMVLVHGAHFLLFAVVGLVLWHSRRDSFLVYKKALVWVLYAGLLGYVLAPTAPPWLGAELGALPPVVRIVSETYTTEIPQLVAAFDTNPVAAMPSLHAALPMVAALLAFQAFGRVVGLLAGAYVVVVAFALVYLGEHYVVDVVAGVLLAIVMCRLASRRRPAPSRMTPTSAALLSLALVTAAFAVFLLSARP